MKTCNKTDFRMYSPLVGPAEEICWTCGVAKEKHDQKPSGLSSGAALEGSMIAGLNRLLADKGVAPSSSHCVTYFDPHISVLANLQDAADHLSRKTGKTPSAARLSGKDFDSLSIQLHGVVPPPRYIFMNGPYGRVEISYHPKIISGSVEWIF